MCIRAVIFKLLSSTEEQLRRTSEKGAGTTTVAEWNETAVVIINGVSELLANYLESLVPHEVFPSLWQDLLDHFATMLDFKALDVNTAVFGSLTSILSKSDGRARRSFNKQAVGLAWKLWSRGVPATEPARDAVKVEDNQKCLVSWVNAFLEIERLMRADMSLETIRQMLRLLRDAMIWASPGSYANDIEYMTPLQSQVLEVLKIVRTDIHGAPSAVILLLADFASMAFDLPEPSAQQKRTFVAMSKASMPILHYHVTQNASEADIFSSGAFSAALTALAKPIALKYRFRITTKSIQPWKESVNATLAILEITLPHLKEKTVPKKAFEDAWDAVVAVSNGIIRADLDEVAVDDSSIATDQQFDISAFRKLRELIIPSLGSGAVAERTRKAYAEGLFRISIVHPLAAADAALIYGPSRTGDGEIGEIGEIGETVVAADLSKLYKAGGGQTIDPPPTKRADMSYVCLDELFALVEAHEDASGKPSIVVLPPTPRAPPTAMTLAPVSMAGKMETAAESEHALHVRLAQTAARYLVLRCALTIRAYVSDQPLRGHMPQPLSQRRELYRMLRQLVDLKSEPGAIPDLEGVESDTRKHLLRLYPLLIKAVQVAGTAGDGKTLELAGEALEAVGSELGV